MSVAPRRYNPYPPYTRELVASQSVAGATQRQITEVHCAGRPRRSCVQSIVQDAAAGRPLAKQGRKGVVHVQRKLDAAAKYITMIKESLGGV